MGREDEAAGVRNFCFGLLMVNSSFATLVVFDLLLLSHSLIFTLTNYVSGEAKYSASTFMISSAIAFKFLLPLLIVQVFWLLSCIMALVALKTLLPYLQLPYLLSSGAVLATLVWIIVSTVQALARASTVEWTLALLLCFANIVFLVQCYFIYVKFACFKVFIRKRKAVTTTERESGKMAISAVDNQFDTYSTKSTVIITDDFLRAPPR